MRARSAWAAGVLALLWLPFLAYGLLAGIDHLVRFFPDDAFYYLQPAFNLSRLGWSTFDRLHATNGYHPLNFAMVSALARLLPKSGLVPATFVVDGAILVGVAWLADLVRDAHLLDRARVMSGAYGDARVSL